jgi:peptide/nickel transport system substrate-binding protein
MRLWSRIMSLAMVLGLLGAACTTADGDGDGGGDGAETTETAEITIALGQEPSTLDPQLVDSGFERAVNDNIYETLLTRTPEGELSADGLAEGMPEQVDNKTWQFTLRDGITWHNGDPFTADDVVASVERIVDPEFASEQGSFFATIT